MIDLRQVVEEYDIMECHLDTRLPVFEHDIKKLLKYNQLCGDLMSWWNV